MRTSRPADGSRPQAWRWLGAVLVALALAVLFAGPAAAAPTAAEVGDALRENPDYVASDAPIKVDRDALRQ